MKQLRPDEAVIISKNDESREYRNETCSVLNMVPKTQNIFNDCYLLYYLVEPCFCSVASSLASEILLICGLNLCCFAGI